MTTTRDIMSFGVLTVGPQQSLSGLVDKLRRVGHEGYPVVAAGQVVGLLTSRDMNRADANNLAHLRVADVMLAGQVSVSPVTPVRLLPQYMIDSGWGQLPVIENNVLIGIVTRTDVIRFYAQAEAATTPARQVTQDEIRSVFGDPAAALIAFIARHAHQHNQTIYMVGGAVRDLLLQRRNLDLDFVLEGAAIPLAQTLVADFGGDLEKHDAFGTAKWIFDAVAAAHIGQPLASLPPYIDLVTARHEFYDEPAVLPTVYTGGIKLDLRRRDFTINALAVRLGVADAGGTVIDLFGGLDDLEAGRIRALHSLSFADDPTRTLRAVRFSHRLGFEIEPRTRELIDTALPMIARVTGERLKNEITLLLHEPNPEAALPRLQQMGVLRAIHPAFELSEDASEIVRRGRERTREDVEIDGDLHRWLWLAACLPSDAIEPIGKRLLLRQNSITTMQQTARLTQQPGEWLTGAASDVTFRLDALELTSIVTAWEVLTAPEYRDTLNHYLTRWRHIHPRANGHTLRERGVPPGPIYKTVLRQLRAAWLDGEIGSEAEESDYLDQLLRESD